MNTVNRIVISSKKQNIMRVKLSIIIPLFFGILLSCSNSQEKNKSEPLEINAEKESTVLVEEIETNNEIYDCEELPSSFYSYEEALERIFKANFRYSDKISITSSSWIRSAAFYSCDGYLGFFIIKTDKQYYIHKDLPIEIWRSFKNSNSYGSYYSHYIKSNYQMIIN
jgi:hypothetical protein